MSDNSSTEGTSTPFQNIRDPLQLLNDSMQDLILTRLADAYGLSPPDLPSMYLAKSLLASAGKRGDKYFMRFDLHIKEQEHAPDVAIICLEFAVNSVKVVESC